MTIDDREIVASPITNNVVRSVVPSVIHFSRSIVDVIPLNSKRGKQMTLVRSCCVAGQQTRNVRIHVLHNQLVQTV